MRIIAKDYEQLTEQEKDILILNKIECYDQEQTTFYNGDSTRVVVHPHILFNIDNLSANELLLLLEHGIVCFDINQTPSNTIRKLFGLGVINENEADYSSR